MPWAGSGSQRDEPLTLHYVNRGKTPFYPICTLIGQIISPVYFFIVNFRVDFKAEHIFFQTDHLLALPQV